MGTIIAAATSNADGATTTSQVFPFLAETVITSIITNGGTPPSQMAMVTLELSTDNSTFTEVDRRWAGAVASQAYYNVFELSNFAGNGSSFGGGSGPQVVQWLYYRLKVTGNVGQAVTCQAFDSDQGNMAVVTLTGVSGTGSAGQGVWTPTWTGPTIIENVIVYATNSSGGAASLFVGVANNATSNTAGLINGAQLNALAGTFVISGANNSTQSAMLNANGSIVFTANANAVGFLGKAFITYIKP